MDAIELTSDLVDMYSDASGNPLLGFGAFCGPEWTFGQWNKEFIIEQKPSIEFLELFAVTVGVINWIRLFKNRKITLFCDNESVVNMMNKMTSSCKRCMVLLRIITLEGLTQNVRISAKHVSTTTNGKANALSQLDFKHFRKLGPNMNKQATEIPKQLWPIDKVWFQ